ncbi:hypothetical protein ACFL6T_03160 [Candidatus Zixiibacteriota bacterium]
MNATIRASRRIKGIMAVSFAAFCILTLASFAWQEMQHSCGSCCSTDGYVGIPFNHPYVALYRGDPEKEYCASIDEMVDFCTCPDKDSLEVRGMLDGEFESFQWTGDEGIQQTDHTLTVRVGEPLSITSIFQHHIDQDLVRQLGGEYQRPGWYNFELNELIKFEIHVMRDEKSGNVPALYWPSSTDKRAGELWGMAPGKTLGKVVLRGPSAKIFFESAPFNIEVVMP